MPRTQDRARREADILRPGDGGNHGQPAADITEWIRNRNGLHHARFTNCCLTDSLSIKQLYKLVQN